MSYSCQCPCGTTRYQIHGEPILRFYCHCTICQQQYASPYVDVSLFKLDDVHLPEDQNITYGRFKRFGAVDRGRCPSCDKPVLSKMGKGDNAFAFLAARNCVNADDLPPAFFPIFIALAISFLLSNRSLNNIIYVPHALILRMDYGCNETVHVFEIIANMFSSEVFKSSIIFPLHLY